MDVTPQMFWIVCPLALLGGFVDAIAGGGGLISLPAYYLAGLPASMAAGTNKLSASMGTVLAVYNFNRSGKINRTIGVPAAVGALVCSALGVLVMKQLPDQVIRLLVTCSIPVAAVFTLKGHGKHIGQKCYSALKTLLLSLMVGCLIGFYDGLVGPGTGVFLILFFVHLFGVDDVMASGTAKLVNLASNMAALTSLLITGDVLFMLGIPAGMCSMLGGFLGSKMTIRKGAGLVRAMMLVVLVLLLAKMITDMLQ